MIELPTWQECADKFPEERSALEKFIHEHEPFDEIGERVFREQLAALIAELSA